MRLIDADALELDVQNLWMQNEISNGDWVGFREMLNSQETIVEFAGDINKVMVKGIEYFPQKTGKWLKKNRVYSEESHIEDWQSCCCSVCGHYDTRPYMYYFDEPNYCSYCGARMENES